jgi:predicted dehydrogenase
MNQLKVGIAGYGVVGKRRHQFIDLNPNFKVVGLCDQYFKGPGVFREGINSYRNYNDLLANESLDVLFVCLTNDIAPEVTIAGLEKNLHVFCEKPPGRNVSDILKVRESELSRPQLKLKYGFNHRYHESVKEALRIVETGELGRVLNMRGVYGKSIMISFESDWRSKRSVAGGGILLDQGIHMVDLMRLTVTKGTLILSGILSGSKSYGQETLKIVYRGDEDGGNPKEQFTSFIKDNSWRDEINEFADCIVNNKKTLHGSSQDALNTMEMVYGIYMADKTWTEKFDIKK